MTERHPAAIEPILKILHAVRDTVKHSNFQSSLRQCDEALVLLMNEQEWCFNSDVDLPYVQAFIEELKQSISVLMRLQKPVESDLYNAIIEEITAVLNKIPKLISAQVPHGAPSVYLDDIEIDARRRKHYENC